MTERPAYVYILRCADGTLYTGYTFELECRIAKHNAGRGAKYTRSRLPVEPVWVKKLPSAHDARRAEVLIKRLTRRDKMRLIEGELTLADIGM